MYGPTTLVRLRKRAVDRFLWVSVVTGIGMTGLIVGVLQFVTVHFGH
jgi:hypothetical protein